MRAAPPPWSATRPAPAAPAPASTRASSPVSAVASAYCRRRSTRSSRLRCSGREKRGSRLYFAVMRCGGLRSGGVTAQARAGRRRRAAAAVRAVLVVRADAHERLLVRRLDAEAHHHRHVELLADLEGQAGVLVALLAVGRLQHRHAAHAAEVAVVLLGHAAGHAGVAGEADDEAAVDARVHGADERVGGHAGAGALHRREGAGAAHGGPERHLVGDLLVGGPLGVDAVVARQAGDDLGAGRAGVGRRHLHARLPGAARHGLVAQHQVRFHAVPRGRSPSSCRLPADTGSVWRGRCGWRGLRRGIPPRRTIPKGAEHIKSEMVAWMLVRMCTVRRR